MGRLLAALRADSGTVPAANLAIVANLHPVPLPIFADSQDSQGIEVETGAVQAARLLAAIRAEFHADALIGTSDATPADLARLDDQQLWTYVQLLAEADLRERGRVPADETAMALCRRCGPVWIQPHVATVAPVLTGWPRLLGCPWCHVKNRRAMATPKITCGTCQHFTRDAINPGEGMGACGAGQDPARPWPYVELQCGQWQPCS